MSDNKTFWKSVQPAFLNKDLNSDNILLGEEIVAIINRYFTNITNHMNLQNQSPRRTSEYIGYI